MLDHVLALLGQSDTHRNWTIEQVNRCIVPPVNLNQCTGIIEGDRLVAWCSWAFMDDEKASNFLDGCYTMQPQSWSSGRRLIFMDFVSPFGQTKQLYRMCRNLFPKYPKAEWRRHLKNRRVGAMLDVK